MFTLSLMIRLLVIGALVFMIWRLLRRSPLLRPAHDPRLGEEKKLRSPYEILEVAQDASADEIRTAYQRKVAKYHPDKVADMGPELRAVAERHTKEINAAYERLKGRR